MLEAQGEALASFFARLDPLLWLVTAQAGERRGGLIATTVVSASIVPALPRVVVGIAQHHHTWQLIEASRAFALHLLGEEHVAWVERFGLTSGTTGDKLADLAHHLGETGSPLLDAAHGWLDCRVETSMATGDRTWYLAEVVASRLTPDGAPLTLQKLLPLLSPERRREMKALRERDAMVDATTIHTWRTEQRNVSFSPQRP